MPPDAEAPEAPTGTQATPAADAANGAVTAGDPAPAEQNGQPTGADAAAATPRTLDDILGAPSLSEADFQDLNERSPGLKQAIEAREERARTNAARAREAQLKRRASTVTGQQDLLKQMLLEAGATPADQEKMLPSLMKAGDRIREAQHKSAIDFIVNDFGNAAIRLTPEEESTIEAHTDFDGNTETETAVRIYLRAAGRQQALEMNADQVLKQHPGSGLARSVDRMVKAGVQAELTAQGIAQAANGAAPPITPTGTGAPDVVTRFESMSDTALMELPAEERDTLLREYMAAV